MLQLHITPVITERIIGNQSLEPRPIFSSTIHMSINVHNISLSVRQVSCVCFKMSSFWSLVETQIARHCEAEITYSHKV